MLLGRMKDSGTPSEKGEANVAAAAALLLGGAVNDFGGGAAGAAIKNALGEDGFDRWFALQSGEEATLSPQAALRKVAKGLGIPLLGDDSGLDFSGVSDGVGRFLQKPSLRLVGEAGPEHILNVDSGPSIRALTEGIRPIIRELFEEERRGGGGAVVNVDLRGSFFPDSRSVEKLFRLLEDFGNGRRVSKRRFS